MSDLTHTEGAAQTVYEQLLTRVGEANPRPRIEPVRRLAELAGSPQLSYPVIQIAGTNGKTSTARAIESLLRAHGLRTGLFTSPHLVSFTERFQLDGAPIDDALIAAAWDEMQPALAAVDAELAESGNGPITFFEALAVLAFVAFADVPVDVAVLEVGMGGEWDATNVADAEVAVFTPVALDHTAILGPDIATIARTKSGIIKPGSTVVTSEQDPAALAEIVSAAEARDVHALVAGHDFSLTEDRLAVGGRQIELSGHAEGSYEPVFVPLYGRHQAENAALAVAAVEAFFDRAIPQEILEEGFGQLTSPGRLQLIGTDPIVYIDAAHNPHGAEALARAVTESFAFTELAVITGVLGEKDAAGVLEALLPVAARTTLVPVDSPRSMDVDQLADVAESIAPSAPITVADSLDEALEVARDWAAGGEGRAVLVAGSVLLAGEALALSRAEGWGTA